MVALLFYGYATGVFSNRKLEKARCDREDRLKALEEAKAKLAQRAAEHQKAEQAEYERR